MNYCKLINSCNAKSSGKTYKRSFISAFSICMTVTLRFDDDIKGLSLVKESEVSSANSFALQRNTCSKSLI